VVERTDLLELMATLKLYGMRAAYDEVMTTGTSRGALSAICSAPRLPKSRRVQSNIN
jgi:hypothetical protein